MDKILKYITRGGNIFITVITGVLMVTLGLYGILMLWDTYRTELKAFASYDLLQYRPNIEEEEPPYLDDLIKINPDVAGWVTIYGTNIDYPVMKGKDDKEYLNKSATGEYSISGSLFMASLNQKDFSDPYTLIYGHHMDNGSMLGDLDKFKDDEAFFNNKNKIRCDKEEEGVLIMQDKVWNLKVIALLETTAYDHDVYRSDKTADAIPGFVDYIKSSAKYYRDMGETDKLIALSTCASATSFDRTVLVCKMEVRTDPLPTREKEPLTPHRTAVGHPMAGAYWALLNLIIMFSTVWVFIGFMRRYRKVSAFTIIECCLALVSVALFVITQDLHKPIQIIDMWTPFMLIILGIMLFVSKLIMKSEPTDNEEESN